MRTKGDSLIKIRNATKIYRKGGKRFYALNSICFEIDKEDFIVIIGEEGAGKTTLLNLIGGIDKPTSGGIFYNGKSVGLLPERELTNYRREQIGFVSRMVSFVDELTVYQNVTLIPGSNLVEPMVNKILRSVEIIDKKNDYPTKLTREEQIRVSIARALNKQNQILLCDDPTKDLDKSSEKEIIKLLKELNEKEGKTIVLATQNKELAKYANKVIEIKDGVVIEEYKNYSEDNSKWWKIEFPQL